MIEYKLSPLFFRILKCADISHTERLKIIKDAYVNLKVEPPYFFIPFLLKIMHKRLNYKKYDKVIKLLKVINKALFIKFATKENVIDLFSCYIYQSYKVSTTAYLNSIENALDYITMGFNWKNTLEGSAFWKNISYKWQDCLNGYYYSQYIKI